MCVCNFGALGSASECHWHMSFWRARDPFHGNVQKAGDSGTVARRRDQARLAHSAQEGESQLGVLGEGQEGEARALPVKNLLCVLPMSPANSGPRVGICILYPHPGRTQESTLVP